MNAFKDKSPLILPPRLFTVNRWLWFFIAALGLLDWVLLQQWGMKVVYRNMADFILVTVLSIAVIIFNGYIRRDDKLFFFANVILQSIYASMALCVWNYLANRWPIPLYDEQLIAIDRFFGFDWLSFIHWVDTQPRLSAALTVIYQLPYQLAVLLLCALFIYKHVAHAQRFILVFCATAFLCVTIAGLIPAVAGYAHYNIDIGQFHNLHPAAGRTHENIVLALRNHSLTDIPYPGVGLVTFPSFHAVMAILLIYASLPFRHLRLIIIPFGLAMLVSCISDGGHYLVDVIAGIIIALAGIWLAERILPRT